MDLKIIDANRGHGGFIAWVLLESARSHLKRGLWDFLVDGSDTDCLRFLEALATTSHPHWAHYSTFIVAAVDGEPAAALCGYFEEENGMESLRKALPEANERVGRTEEEQAAGTQRAIPIVHVAPDHEPGAWIIENVATHPSFRRKGLVDRLLAEILERGRGLGATIVDIGVLIGNDPAQRAYEKAGFEVIGEKRHPDFEAVWGCPGIRSMSQRL